MRKKLNFVIRNILFVMFGLITVSCLFLKFRPDLDQSLSIGLFILLAIIELVLIIWANALKEKERQQSKQKILNALADAVELHRGYSHELIQRHDMETYNILQEKGFIHEPQLEALIWEVTKYGIKTFNEHHPS